MFVAMLVPRSPSACTAQSDNATSMTLVWNSTESTNSYFITYQGIGGVVNYRRSNATTLKLYDLRPGSSYTFTIQSEGAGGNSSATSCSGFTGKFVYRSRLLVNYFE